MPDQDRIRRWMTGHERLGHFSTDQRIVAYSDFMDYKFFSPGTMRSFNSRMCERVFPSRMRTLFVTSERGGGGYPERRRYSIRYIKVQMDDGSLGIDIGSEGSYPHPSYNSARQAYRAIEHLIAEENATEPTPELAAALALAQADYDAIQQQRADEQARRERGHQEMLVRIERRKELEAADLL